MCPMPVGVRDIKNPPPGARTLATITISVQTAVGKNTLLLHIPGCSIPDTGSVLCADIRRQYKEERRLL